MFSFKLEQSGKGKFYDSFGIFGYFAEVSITVECQSNSGTFGTVQVDYRTSTAVQTFSHLPAGVSRASNTDFVITNNSVISEPGVISQEFNITITDDTVPEVNESVFVTVTDASLVERAQLREGMAALLWVLKSKLGHLNIRICQSLQCKLIIQLPFEQMSDHRNWEMYNKRMRK